MASLLLGLSMDSLDSFSAGDLFGCIPSRRHLCVVLDLVRFAYTPCDRLDRSCGLKKRSPSKGCDELSPSQGRGLRCSPLGSQELRTGKERTLLHLFFSTESSICINKDCNLVDLVQ
ncbi:Chaperone protein DnaK [Dissostichus eleginoides]|uniref:Chaperone protein DnaK n=1 Tax=Dissostichus eleginoides TaxID=100907 RepID=A0AAD9C1H5_DISEL|nr:Chaperone protein DnaK [Dissostichus eleginoides]